MNPEPDLPSRLLLGAIAGFAATLPMTMVMRAAHRRLPEAERYPLTPREIIDAAGGSGLGEARAADVTVAGHFAYGALAGAAMGAAAPRIGPFAGAAAGAGIWAASYLGWIPAARLLTPATRHPLLRNAVMIGAHLLWGAATSIGGRELADARVTIFGPGPDRDRPADAPIAGGRGSGPGRAPRSRR